MTRLTGQAPAMRFCHPNHRLNTVEPHVAEARALVSRLRASLNQTTNRRLRDAFTALAGGDAAIGLLAYYLWRQSRRR